MQRRIVPSDVTADPPHDLDSEPDEPNAPDDSDFEEAPCTDDLDERRWEAFIPDDDEFDPEPEYGDFSVDDWRAPTSDDY
jgi:hypothetical protein